MMECERCGDAMERLLGHREYGVAVTHRITRWLCPDCHPTVPTRRPAASPVETEESANPIVTDGGTVTACPRCTSSTINVQGIQDCLECRWTSH